MLDAAVAAVRGRRVLDIAERHHNNQGAIVNTSRSKEDMKPNLPVHIGLCSLCDPRFFRPSIVCLGIRRKQNHPRICGTGAVCHAGIVSLVR